MYIISNHIVTNIDISYYKSVLSMLLKHEHRTKFNDLREYKAHCRCVNM